MDTRTQKSASTRTDRDSNQHLNPEEVIKKMLKMKPLQHDALKKRRKKKV
jgi:hypothetical protein